MNMFHEVSDGKASMISDHMAATMRGPWKIALYAQWAPRLASATGPVEFVSLPESGKMSRDRAGQAPPYTGVGSGLLLRASSLKRIAIDLRPVLRESIP